MKEKLNYVFSFLTSNILYVLIIICFLSMIFWLFSKKEETYESKINTLTEKIQFQKKSVSYLTWDISLDKEIILNAQRRKNEKELLLNQLTGSIKENEDMLEWLIEAKSLHECIINNNCQWKK